LLKALPYRPEIDLEAIDLYLSCNMFLNRARFIKIFTNFLPRTHWLGKWSSEGQLLIGIIHTNRSSRATRMISPRNCASVCAEAVKMRLISEVPLGAHFERRTRFEHRRGADGRVERRASQNIFGWFPGRKNFLNCRMRVRLRKNIPLITTNSRE